MGGGRTALGLRLADCLLDYRLHPGALDVLARLRSLGPTFVLSDGDAVFRPHEIRRSGVWDAVEGRVLVYVHEEDSFDDVERRCPAQRYVRVDDKPRILAAAKAR